MDRCGKAEKREQRQVGYWRRMREENPRERGMIKRKKWETVK